VGSPLAGIGLLVATVLWVAQHPASGFSRSLLKASERSLPFRSVELDEYLVFLREDTPEVRRRVLEASPALSFVADSFLPRVMVVRIEGPPDAVLEILQGQGAVRMVFRYDPSLGCH
jgi:hypothetical protein